MKLIYFTLPLLIFALSCNTETENKSDPGDQLQSEVDNLQQENDSLKAIAENIEEKIEIPAEYLITDKNAGIFKVGQPIQYPSSSDSYTVKKEIQTRMTEEGPAEETVFVVSEGNEILLNIAPEYDWQAEKYSDNIGSITVLSPKYMTNEGIGVGSTIEEFTEKYPDPKLWYTYVSGMYIIETDKLNIQFMLREKDFSGTMVIKGDMTTLNYSDFAPESKIIKVRIL